MKQENDTDQEISDYLIQNTGDCIMVTNINNANLDHQQEVPVVCQICREKSL
jgi:hypothetical protein